MFRAENGIKWASVVRLDEAATLRLSQSDHELPHILASKKVVNLSGCGWSCSNDQYTPVMLSAWLLQCFADPACYGDLQSHLHESLLLASEFN